MLIKIKNFIIKGIRNERLNNLLFKLNFVETRLYSSYDAFIFQIQNEIKNSKIKFNEIKITHFFDHTFKIEVDDFKIKIKPDFTISKKRGILNTYIFTNKPSNIIYQFQIKTKNGFLFKRDNSVYTAETQKEIQNLEKLLKFRIQDGDLIQENLFGENLIKVIEIKLED